MSRPFSVTDVPEARYLLVAIGASTALLLSAAIHFSNGPISVGAIPGVAEPSLLRLALPGEVIHITPVGTESKIIIGLFLM